MLLDRYIDKIKRDEQSARDAFGISMNIAIYTGSSDCPTCTYDEFYRSSNNPVCPTCNGVGKLYTEEITSENVLAKWLTLSEMTSIQIGQLITADVVVTAAYESYSKFLNAQMNKIDLFVDGATVIISKVVPSTLRTKIKVYCSRKI